ncbi:hypothetical protein D9757_007163 [Collybiopsis confluens]|uniref:Uncharacterized protein n=1 Tax=Collybiopsis confluens TaxID=2823264 RepID=A0A8H5HCF5_9AGAR|nr:hypothetical protein D9757_007163 [Collybiopsis confluens]
MAMFDVEQIYNGLLVSTSSTVPNNDKDESYLVKLTNLVQQATVQVSPKANIDTRRMQWEYLIRRDVFKHAALEGKALSSSSTLESKAYYSQLKSWLDLALVFTESGVTDASYTFALIQDLLETQTIPSCSRIFDWVELRSKPSYGDGSASGRLTQGMIPQKGKALVLLRTLNDLLRRLSKAGRETIGFSGRILTFLSQVFPLGERSGVNLRGEYGPVWDMPQVENKDLEDDDFYHTFWSLQLPFSKPSIFALQQGGITFSKFQDSVDKMLPVIKEATAKERALMGSGRSAASSSASPPSAGIKRKRDDLEDNSSSFGHSVSQSNSYFFTKFLTSPDLLDLEIADVHFRRQILFQLLILLTHLLNFTKANKPTWMTARNRSLHMPLGSGGQEWSLDDALVLESTSKGTEKREQETKDAEKGKENQAASQTSETGPSASNPNPNSSASAPSATNPAFSSSAAATALDSPDRLDPILWVNRTISRTLEEIRQTQPTMMTMPSTVSSSSLNSTIAGETSSVPVNGSSGLSGRQFSETIQTMLEREKGWIKWKNELCDAGVFERGRWEVEDELIDALAQLEALGSGGSMEVDGVGDEGRKKRTKLTMTMYDATRPLRVNAQKKAGEDRWQWELGTEALTEIWTMGYRGLDDLERGFSPGTPHDFLRQIDMEDRRMEARKKTLRAQQERILVQKEKMEREKREKLEAQERETKIQNAKGLTKTKDSDVEMKSAEETNTGLEQQQDVEMQASASPIKTEPPAPEPILGSQSSTTPTTKPPSSTQPPPTSATPPASTLAPPLHPSLPPKPGSISRSASPTVGAPVKHEPAAVSVTNKTTTPVPTSAPAPAPAVLSLPPDEQIRKAEESKTRISWLALRAARDSAQGYIAHFGKIGTGDMGLLVEEIEKAETAEVQESKDEKEKEKIIVDEGHNREKEKEKAGEEVKAKMEVDKVEQKDS